MPITPISSDDFIEIEQHFRVSAGPGAGKTHWLVNHVKHILRDSVRLGRAKKIACITYTNVAAETIKENLGSDAERVEVSTIHSFLYRYIVKPYLEFIDPIYCLNTTRVDGHDDHIPSRAMIVQWIKAHPNKTSLRHPFSEKQLTTLPDHIFSLSNWMEHFTYRLDTFSTSIVPHLDERKGYTSKLNKHTVSTLSKDILSYKKQYWRKGILHHEDVLFFSHHLLGRYPFLLEVIRSRFPYFLVDEFQDTSPVQTLILTQFGQTETMIGVVGDEYQSIYGFTGADITQYKNFSLPGIQDFQISDNRRSTNSIINLLNRVRSTMPQIGLRNVEGTKPILFIGSKLQCYNEIKNRCSQVELCCLTRKNVTANALRNEIDPTSVSDSLLQEMRDTDSSNSTRRRWITFLMEAIVYAREGRFKEALKSTKKLGLEKNDGLVAIKSLLDEYCNYRDQPISVFYSKIQALPLSPSLSNLRNGKPKKFYDNTTFTQLSLCINLTENDSLYRTIHKAKGAEFSATLIILEKEEDLEFVHSPKLDSKEEHRIYYVGASRAQNLLCISVPNLSSEVEKKIGHSLQIVRL